MALLLPGELAWYVTGRFYERSDHSLADCGYFLHLAGIEADLFGGKPSERTAHFTFAAEPFTPRSGVKPCVNRIDQPRSSYRRRYGRTAYRRRLPS